MVCTETHKEMIWLYLFGKSGAGRGQEERGKLKR